MQIVDYKIVTANTPENLQSQIQALITEGWQPVGAADANAQRYPGQNMGRAMTTFMQTMVKYGP